jgi:hypothetical protein
MSGLEKAILVELTAGPKPDEKKGTEVAVQFNPTTLRMTLTNTTEGGKTRGRQVEQYLGAGSTALSLDLVFDTADEGTPDKPKDVRDKTRKVARFLLPAKAGKQAPPRVRFHWGTVVVDGLMDSFVEDLDLFSAGGVPLRAKVTITIKGQDPKFALKERGAGANTGADATQPGGNGGTGPGSTGGGPGTGDRTGTALASESAADFATRMGLDPAAWRGLSAGLDSTLSLEAGAEIDFSAGLSASAGVGLAAGFEAGSGVSLDASFGLEGGAAAGFSLSAAGGLGAALETTQIVRTEAAAGESRSAFGASVPSAPPAPPATAGAASLPSATAAAAVSGPAAPPRPTAPEQRRPPLAQTGLPSRAAQAAAAPAPLSPIADARATSFGFGVPLRPQIRIAAEPAASPNERVVLRPRLTSLDEPPVTPDPTVAPWLQLPSSARGRSVADTEQHRRRPTTPCGCGCGGDGFHGRRR